MSELSICFFNFVHSLTTLSISQVPKSPPRVTEDPKPLEFVKLEPLDIDDDEFIEETEPDPTPAPKHYTMDTVTKRLIETEPYSEQRHKCKQCTASFQSVKSLSAHMRVHKVSMPKVVKSSMVETKVKILPAPPMVNEKVQWICTICNTEFSSLKSLK